jgi:signal transduction histidine kinase
VSPAGDHPSAQRIDDASGATATLVDVDIWPELHSRPPRPRNLEAEERALAALGREMAENPRNLLQKLVQIAIDLCQADTAGVSLLEGDVFRWEAVAGVFESFRNGTMPRAASPCGVCIAENSTQLMYLADRCFPALRAEPRFVEALLIPFHDRGTPVGTLWVVTHRDDRKFDREDERVLRTLSQFASAGWHLVRALDAADEANQRKDEFLAILGHELRTPLSAIMSATEVLAKATARPEVEVLRRQSRHLSRLADDLLDVPRVGQGKLELLRTAVDVRSVMGHALEMTSNAGIDRTTG